MIDLDMVRPGQTIYIPFASYASSTGASITLTGLATSDILVYKDGGTTQRASTNGYTLLDTDGIDFDGITGVHGISIDLADNTTAGFWAAGSRYFVVVSTVTIDSQTVSFVAAQFRIGQPAAVLNTTIATLASQTSFTLTAGPAEDDALNGMWVMIHDVASAVQAGYAEILDYTGSTKTVTLAAATTFTAAATDNISVMGPAPMMPTVTGRRAALASGGQIGLNWADIAGPTTSQTLSGTTVGTATAVTNQVTANVTQISGDTAAADNAEAFFDGTGYAGTNNVIPTVTSVTNQVTANVTALSGDATAADNAEAFFDGTGYAGTGNVIPTVTTLTGHTPQTGDAFARLGAPAGASVSADIAAIEAQTDDIGTAGAGLTAVPWNPAWDAEVQSEVEDAIVVHRLDELLAADSDIDGAAPPAVGSVFHELMTKTAGSFTYDQTTDSLEAVRDKAADIEADTQDLQARTPAALVGGRMDSNVGALSGDATAADNAESFFDGTGYAGTGNVIPTVTTLTGHTPQTGDAFARLGAPAGASVSADVAAITAFIDTEVAAILAAVDTEVAAIKAKTDNLPADPADQSLIEAAITNALTVTTIPELAQAAPAATPTIASAIMLLYMATRNQHTQDATTRKYTNDAGTVIAKSTTTFSGGTFTQGELVSGP